ncbi:MAG TPA: hypothetical protein VG488_12450 [Candidatus Angelobacter sp.]|nr:hypothetical protein [Candidatus Angelobacter sp.]
MGQESQNELQDLTAVHGFYLSVLQKNLGHGVPVPAEVKHSSNGQGATPEAAALKHWLDLLDMAICPPMVRDLLKSTQGFETSHALLRYYVTKASQRANDRDKLDCVTTLLFRQAPPDSPHKWQRPETDSSYYFMSEAAQAFKAELLRALGGTQFDSMPAEHVQFLREFEFLFQELEEFRHFDQIMDSGIVQRVRELKQSLGKSFYHPDSLANIAVWNDVFGRRFDDLFHDATKQIKTFAENVQKEGGSIMSRVEGDITVKQLTEIKTQQILAQDYQFAQDSFRKVSKFKKAVDNKKSGRVVYAPIPPRAAPMPPPAPAPGVRPSIPSASPQVQPLAAATAEEMAPPRQATAPPRPQPQQQPQMKQQAEVLAVPPSQAVQNAIQEGKIHSAREAIKNYVRTADPKYAHIVPIKNSKITLTLAEVEAFRTDYQGEKSFRADYVNIMMILVAYLSRMIVEVDEYNQKTSSAYLWKPHVDSLGYLLTTLDRLGMEAEQIRNVARQRGLQDKASAIEASLAKLKEYARTVSQTLQSVDKHAT